MEPLESSAREAGGGFEEGAGSGGEHEAVKAQKSEQCVRHGN